jgi:hypothetical protein
MLEVNIFISCSAYNQYIPCELRGSFFKQCKLFSLIGSITKYDYLEFSYMRATAGALALSLSFSYSLKGQSHEKVGELRVRGISLGPH